MRIELDVERCIGAGMCALTASDLFDQDEDEGTVVLLAQPATPAQERAARQAADRCPSGTIRVVDDHARQESSATT
ncbi:ferredoxin [Spongiactinospora gelatinilytica]|uniref:Ferredoxin n=1 Tax=Spongiactinospora gelatinilytica TaxID=2666298 RepID=A0A2W2G6T5_9ACTN|nr:ferredoxin [Spongiactinospora gelatinilytica]PZG38159.1 ferredoxin [Spongiactinospora gelatinilytica]